MGTTKGLYKAEFPAGTVVRVKDQGFLTQFKETWKYHHPLEEEQVAFAGRVATVKSCGFYHGGDELYELEDIPGVWHEKCLQESEEENR